MMGAAAAFPIDTLIAISQAPATLSSKQLARSSKTALPGAESCEGSVTIQRKVCASIIAVITCTRRNLPEEHRSHRQSRSHLGESPSLALQARRFRCLATWFEPPVLQRCHLAVIQAPRLRFVRLRPLCWFVSMRSAYFDYTTAASSPSPCIAFEINVRAAFRRHQRHRGGGEEAEGVSWERARDDPGSAALEEIRVVGVSPNPA